MSEPTEGVLGFRGLEVRGMFIIIGGVLAAILGIIGIVAWWSDFLLMLRGLVPIVVALGGLIAIWAGIDEIKTNREWEREEAAAQAEEQRAAAEASQSEASSAASASPSAPPKPSSSQPQGS